MTEEFYEESGQIKPEDWERLNTKAMRTDITPDKIRGMAHFELVLDPMDSTMNTLLKVLHHRKEYAKAFLQTGDENILHYIETCNKNIKLIMSL